MLWLVATSFAVNLAALGTAAALARAGRAPRRLLRAAFLAAALSCGIALWSVHVLREGFRAAEVAGAAEKSAVLAHWTGDALNVALTSLIIASLTLAVLVGFAFRRAAGAHGVGVAPGAGPPPAAGASTR